MAEPHSRPVTVVVLARDAEATIRRTVRAIGEQQICRPGSPFDVTVLVVVNGTSDRTADTALQTWRALPDAGHAGARLHVHEVDAPGKANGWNLAVHECTAQTPDAFVFCDSDIHFERPDTFGMLLDALDGTPHAIVATPVPQKSISGVRSPVVRARDPGHRQRVPRACDPRRLLCDPRDVRPVDGAAPHHHRG